MSQESVCELCENKRWICPSARCTKGKIPKDLEMNSTGCGVSIRCPDCLNDLDGALYDKRIMERYYYDDKNPIVLNRYKRIRHDIKTKFPNWVEGEEVYEACNFPTNNRMFDREERDRVEPKDSENCFMCKGKHWICPGCTSGLLSHKLYLPCDLRVVIRCPCCMDCQEAVGDNVVAFRNQPEPALKEEWRSRLRMIKDDIVSKYPAHEFSPFPSL